MGNFRIERDSMGEVQVPAGAYYGAQTQRAVENFPISGIRFPRPFIRALGIIKRAAVETNAEIGLLPPQLAEAIGRAAAEVIEGRFDDQFVVDIFQTGSGTSTNMNANEVIANRAIELLGGEIGSKKPVHPNDHVNLGQSSNDVIPTAIHVAVLEAITGRLIPALAGLETRLAEKAEEFDPIVKIGRTHLQDATPVRLGQEFGGYANQVKLAIRHIEATFDLVAELPLGGTAVGTGINTHPDFPNRTIARIKAATGLPFREAENHFAAQGGRDAVVAASGALKVAAVALTKIANDIRWLASGPRCGIGEIQLPSLQPGSSIMPGKVNPVLPEALLMVCAQVIANDLAVTLGGQAGNFELNVMMPLMAHNLLQSIAILAAAAEQFAVHCIAGIAANAERCAELIEYSLAMCTTLAPVIGYDRAAEIAKEAYRSGKTVRQVLLEKKLLPEEQVNRLLDPMSMTRPGVGDYSGGGG